jgi:hypothetical protein
MESKSFLLSFFDIYKDLSIKEAKVLSNCIEVQIYNTMLNSKEQSLEINFESIPGFYQYAKNIVQVQSQVLNLKMDYSTLELSIANLYIQEIIKRSIKYSAIKNGKLLYILNSSDIEIDLPSKPIVETSYNDLLLCSILSRGYYIKEVKGSHFIITGEDSVPNMVTRYNCTCDDFSLYRDCEHNRAAKAIISNRSKVSSIIQIE